MFVKMTSALAAAVLAVALTGGTLESQGKGKGEDKGKAGADRGRGKAPAAPAARAEQRGKGYEKGEAQRAANRGRDDQPAAARARDDAPGARGKARAAEVREVGGAVAGPADAAVSKRAERVARGRASGNDKGRFFRAFDPDDTPDRWRAYALSSRLPELYAGRVASLALARGVSEHALVITPSGDRVLIANSDGVVLLDLDERRARNLGAWRVVTLDDRDENEGSPAFCRSGAGHPVWGRQWCLDKGFGLGTLDGYRWGRAVSVENVILRPATTGDLTRDVLATVLGDVAFNRLAAHAITLGLVDPLVGRWEVEPTGRRVLLVSSGSVPVAEIVDADGDNRADILLVALKPW